MKKFTWLLILQLSLTALIPKADLSQLGLLGNMYQHFIEFHTDENKTSRLKSFLDFIAEHYGKSQHEHHDEDEHDQLPFKDFTSGSFFLIEHPIIPVSTVILYDAEYFLIHGDLFPDGFISSIDHPPAG